MGTGVGLKLEGCLAAMGIVLATLYFAYAYARVRSFRVLGFYTTHLKALDPGALNPIAIATQAQTLDLKLVPSRSSFHAQLGS